MPTIHCIYKTEAGHYIYLFPVVSQVKLTEKQYQQWLDNLNCGPYGIKVGKRYIRANKLSFYGIDENNLYRWPTSTLFIIAQS